MADYVLDAHVFPATHEAGEESEQLMAENSTVNTGRTGAEGIRQPAGPSQLVRSSQFKYYIHDGIECCRLQLIGELNDLDVAELTGCWNTARTTLGSRRLELDVTALRKTDDAGHEWLLAMVREGAVTKPESYFRDRLAGRTPLAPTDAGAGRTGRLGSWLRGGRDLEVPGSTRVR